MCICGRLDAVYKGKDDWVEGALGNLRHIKDGSVLLLKKDRHAATVHCCSQLLICSWEKRLIYSDQIMQMCQFKMLFLTLALFRHCFGSQELAVYSGTVIPHDVQK